MSNLVIESSPNDIFFFLLSLNREGHGKISVFAVKMALATLCGGKIMDKLRCKLLFVSLFAYPSYNPHFPLPRSRHIPLPTCDFPYSVGNVWNMIFIDLHWALNFVIEIFS